jgi:hypothetical protein
MGWATINLPQHVPKINPKASPWSQNSAVQNLLNANFCIVLGDDSHLQHSGKIQT